MNEPMTPGQILGICSNVATELEGTDITLDQAQVALKNPNCRKSFVAVLKNGGNLPNGKYGMLGVVRVHKDKEKVLPGSDYMSRARKASQGRANDPAFDHYSKPENWHLLPTTFEGENVEYIFFPDTEFDSGDDRRVRCLFRGGSGWGQRCDWVGNGFRRRCLVAVLAN